MLRFFQAVSFRRYGSTFRAGDIAIIRPLKNTLQAFLTRPLKPGATFHTQLGEVSHDDILGQPKRVFLEFHRKSSVKDQKNQRYVATEPTLDEYTSLIPRKAQPIYTMDANTIVQLAEIDICAEDTRHYLEAGTGNGSLTLSICEKIHGTNAVARHSGDQSLRGSILHSIDRRADHSAMGQANVANFKRGAFSSDVQFYVSPLPSQWLEETPGLQLSGVFLDLPKPHLYLADISVRLEPDATLVVFCPSVTQILRCREVLADARLDNVPIDLQLVKTLELPPGNGGGTREWDVNTVFTRETREKVSVCRPKAGSRVVGGGFVGVFKRLSVMGGSILEK